MIHHIHFIAIVGTTALTQSGTSKIFESLYVSKSISFLSQQPQPQLLQAQVSSWMKILNHKMNNNNTTIR